MQKARDSKTDTQELRAAWQRTRTSWRHTEKSLRELLDANRELANCLGKTGAARARTAFDQFDRVIHQLDGQRVKAREHAEKLAETAGLKKAPRKRASAARA